MGFPFIFSAKNCKFLGGHRGAPNWLFANFPKNTPGECPQDAANKFSLSSDHWKHVRRCTLVGSLWRWKMTMIMMMMMMMNTFSGQNRKFQSVIFSKVFGIFRFCKRVRVPDDVLCPLKKIGMLKSVWKGSKCDWQNRPFAVFEVPRYIVQRWRGRLRLGRRPLPPQFESMVSSDWRLLPVQNLYATNLHLTSI